MLQYTTNILRTQSAKLNLKCPYCVDVDVLSICNVWVSLNSDLTDADMSCYHLYTLHGILVVCYECLTDHMLRSQEPWTGADSGSSYSTNKRCITNHIQLKK